MKKIKIKLSCNTKLVPHGEIVCYIYNILTSTNIKAWELCKENIEKPFVVVAKQQTAGKGQRGNFWHSSLGGLYLTVVLSSEVTFNNINHLTLFCGVGIVDELNKYNIPIKVKWLNDLILDNKKLGGILSEVRSQSGTIQNMIIGIGINWENEISLDNSISLGDYLRKNNHLIINSYDRLLEIVVKGILNSYICYVEEGINVLREKYNQYLIYRGKEVVYENMKGIILGVDENGNLMVKFSSIGSSSKVLFSPVKYGITCYGNDVIIKIFERVTNN